MPGGDHPNTGLVAQRSDNAVRLDARYSEYDFNAFPDQRFCESFPPA